MRNISLITDPELYLYYLKYGKNDVTYIDSIPYEGINLNSKVKLEKVGKSKIKTLTARIKRNFK